MMPSINIEYIVVHLLDYLFGVPVDLHGVPRLFLFLVETVATVGMVCAVMLLVLLLFVRIKLINAEHHGFLVREEKERLSRHHEQKAAKNPRWEMIAGLANSTNESEWRRAILEADILLAALLSEQGIPGETVGEQLKNGNPLQFTTLDLAWEAHKVRNAVAHLGEGFPLTERDVRATIDQYRRVFEEFNFI
jgi:hypothetical protein